MNIRFMLVALAGVWVAAAGAFEARAQDPRQEALGGSSVVVQTDTSALSLFNLGNPAGAAFLPHQDRLDLLATVRERVRWAEFTTLYSRNLHSVDNFDVPVDAYGNTTYTDTFGNTLAPAMLYARRSSTYHASLNDWGKTGYGGYLLWLDPAWVLQVVPQASGDRVGSSDLASETAGLSAGGKVRGAWQAAPDLAVGAGATAASGGFHGWGLPDWSLDPAGNTTNPRDAFARTELQLGVEAGAAWRLAAVFDAQDRLDLGLNLDYARLQSNQDETLHAGTDGSDPVLGAWHMRADALPAQIQVQGVYDYQSVMDLALVAAYQNERLYRAVQADGQPDPGESLAEALENFDYELSLRVNLPMVRQDDLRFGIVFNNRGIGHPYPNGRWLQYQPDGLYAAPLILTGSSSIGIATAIVPEEGSLITLEYFLGSSKSRQDRTPIASSGYNRFNLGAQYQVMEGLVVRAGYSDLRVAYENQEVLLQFGTDNYPLLDANGNLAYATKTVIRSDETSSFSFGVSLGDKPWRVDLTGVVAQTGYSPFGWTMLDKPTGLDNVSQDQDLRYSVSLGLRWLF